MTKLGPRLNQAVSYTKGFNVLADIGTDHAYLPIKAIQLGNVQKAIASDNKEKPLQNAMSNIKKSGLSDRIETVLSDGLDNIKAEVDLITILGVGGILITEILGKADLKNVKRLILSPNSETATVRKWLENNHFEIEAEEFIEEKHTYYQLIVAKHGEMKLNEIEREFGPVAIRSNDMTFHQYLYKLIYKLEMALSKARKPDELNSLNLRIKTLKALIK